MNRIDRLTAILIQLQTKRVVKAEEIADRFEISLRTVYRDVKALMEAGVPIGSEAGIGYFLVDGYRLPPVMFTQEEASAMVLGGKLVEKMTDKSVRDAFTSALAKITSVLNDPERDHLEHLHEHVEVRRSPRENLEPANKYLTEIQQCVVEKQVIDITYYASYRDQLTTRTVEPIGLFYYGSAWHLIGWCQLRNDYRDFRADRIQELTKTGKTFAQHNLLSLREYVNTVMQQHMEVERVVLIFDKDAARFISEQKYSYGYLTEDDLGDRVRMTFLTGRLNWIARWIIGFGNRVTVESPEELNTAICKLLEELTSHYMPAVS